MHTIGLDGDLDLAAHLCGGGRIDAGSELLAADEQYEQMLMGSLVNTFVTYYSLENITILSDGEYCVSQRNIYDAPLSFFYL